MTYHGPNDPFDFESSFATPATVTQAIPDPRIVSGGPASGIPPGFGGMSQEMQPRPPANEQELAQRTNAWQRFLGALTTDPNLRNSILTFGATAMQPRQGGQTQAGQIGQAIGAGLQTYDTGKRADRQESRADRQLKAYEQQVSQQGESLRGNQALRQVQIKQIEQAIAATDPSTPQGKAALDYMGAQTTALLAQAARDSALAKSGGRAPDSAQLMVDRYVAALLDKNKDLSLAEANLQAIQFLEGSTSTDPRSLYTRAFSDFMRSQGNNVALFEEGNFEKALDNAKAFAMEVSGYNPGTPPPTTSPPPSSGTPAPTSGTPTPEAATPAPSQQELEADAQATWDAFGGSSQSPTKQDQTLQRIRAVHPGLANWAPTGYSGTVSQFNLQGLDQRIRSGVYQQ